MIRNVGLSIIHGNYNLRIAYDDGPKIVVFSMHEIPEEFLVPSNTAQSKLVHSKFGTLKT